MSAPVARRADELDGALLEMLQALVARAPLFAELRARGEAEDLIQEALIAVRRRVGDGDVDDPFAYARRVVQNLARRAYARARPEAATDAAVLEAAGPVRDVAEVAEWRFELEEVLGMVRAVQTIVCELPADEVELVRAELRREDQRALARRMGMSRATFYRRKRVVLCGFVTAVASGARAEPCADRVEALLAAAGGSAFASARRAREHAQGCLQCETTLRHLTAARHGLALVAPLPSLVVVDSVATAERVGLAVHEWWEVLRGIVVRGPDPAAALPASKGAAAALAAACVGVGGTTYCAVDGVPQPVRGVLGLSQERAPVARPVVRTVPPSAPVRAVSPATAVGRQSRAAASAPAKPVARRAPRSAEFQSRGAASGSADAEFRSPPPPAVAAAVAPGRSVAAGAGSADAEFGGAAPSGEFR